MEAEFELHSKHKLGKTSFTVTENKKRMFFPYIILLSLLSKVNEAMLRCQIEQIIREQSKLFLLFDYTIEIE